MVPGWRGLPDGLTNLSFCLTHGVNVSTCLWEGAVPEELESWSGLFLVSTLLGSGVFTGVPCWSDCEVVYPIECRHTLWIPWLFLEGLPLPSMVFMSVVSLLISLQEAMVFCICMVLVANEHFLSMQNGNSAIPLDFKY